MKTRSAWEKLDGSPARPINRTAGYTTWKKGKCSKQEKGFRLGSYRWVNEEVERKAKQEAKLEAKIKREINEIIFKVALRNLMNKTT
jgi:hypothetical protein